MLKSVWLTKLIVSALNDASSITASYWRHVCGLLGARGCLMCLFEPDGGGATYIRITALSACVVPAPGGDEKPIRAAMNARKCVKCGNWLYAPLCFDNVSAFGCLLFADAENAGGERADEALKAFSSILYSESMGSIVKSYHPVALRAENVCVDYKSGKMVNRAVKNVNLEICEKEFTVIMGASGSGKSSLLNVLGGMRTPEEGHVWWRGADVARMSEKARTAYRANTVGFVFQRYNLISDLTAEENVRIAASLVKNPLSPAEVLDMVGLSHKARSYPASMSGGEQQRVCIARALVKRAGLLLCDEPTGALDTENAAHVIRLLKGISKEQSIPVAVITHNPNLVVLGDHCLTMSNGTVIDDVFQPFALEAK